MKGLRRSFVSNTNLELETIIPKKWQKKCPAIKRFVVSFDSSGQPKKCLFGNNGDYFTCGCFTQIGANVTTQLRKPSSMTRLLYIK